jgi:2-octaprenyl-6-methoxyphenol hydroxylase
VVWVVPAEQAPALSTWESQEWSAAIDACFGTSDGRILQCSVPAQYPLRAREVNEQARSRLAVVGNGALTLHPIAGQGFNLHCRTVYELGQTLKNATDPGEGALLQQWQRHVKTDQAQVKTGCDGLLTLFESWHPALAHTRGLGLQVFNGLPYLPEWLKRKAMGLGS